VKTFSSGEKYQLVAEINMIPFIDIALVLLIIFMVMTPFLVKNQIKINPPKVKGAHSAIEGRKRVQIDVARDGAIRVDGVTVGSDTIENALRRRLTDPENQSVIIAADRDVVFQKVVTVMDAATRCGVKHLGVNVKQERAGDDAASGGAPRPRPRGR
jgi:biopolymer transport protein ExbD